MVQEHKTIASRMMVGVAVNTMMNHSRQILQGIANYANLRRRWILVEDLQLLDTEPARWPFCDGIITVTSNERILKSLRKKCRHLVCCSGGADPQRYHVVASHDIAVGMMAAEHLMTDCRFKNFGYFGDNPAGPSAKRLAGFEQGLAEYGFTCMEAPVTYRWSPHPYGVAKSLLKELIAWLRELPKPVGIFARDDMAARDLAMACLQGDITVPDQVAILGVNNDELLCQTAWPALSSIDVGAERIGYTAAQMMDRLLAGEKFSYGHAILLDPLKVVRRVSTSVLDVRDEKLAAVLRFIHEHACDPCTVKDILSKVRVHRRWLERQFINQLGRTPHEEILHVRMQMACQALLQPELSLPDVARHIGFSTISSFTRAFSQYTGQTPGTYRRMRLKAAMPGAQKKNPTVSGAKRISLRQQRKEDRQKKQI